MMGIIGAVLAVSAMSAATRGPRGTGLALEGKASDAMSEIDKYNRVMRMLAHAEDKSESTRIKATQNSTGAFEDQFDAAFNKGWRDAQSAARRDDAFYLFLQKQKIALKEVRVAPVCLRHAARRALLSLDVALVYYSMV